MESNLTTPAAALVTLANAKLHCKVDVTDDDTLFSTYYLPAATEYVERESAMKLGTQTWTLTFPRFVSPLYLPSKPVQSITSIQYYADGTLTTWNSSNYRLIKSQRHTAFVELTATGSVPSVDCRSDAWVVTYVAGYSTVPPLALQAVLLATSLWNEDRTGEQHEATATAVTRLCNLFRGY